MITVTFEPIRSIYANHPWRAFYRVNIVGAGALVQYGESHWPSLSYWMVPGLEY